MEPGQYTGKTDATQGEAPRGDAAPGAPSPPSASPPASPVPGVPRSAPGGGPRRTTGRGMVPKRSVAGRILLWGTVAVVIVAGLLLYFRYEPSVVPLLRGRR